MLRPHRAVAHEQPAGHQRTQLEARLGDEPITHVGPQAVQSLVGHPQAVEPEVQLRSLPERLGGLGRDIHDPYLVGDRPACEWRRCASALSTNGGKENVALEDGRCFVPKQTMKIRVMVDSKGISIAARVKAATGVWFRDGALPCSRSVLRPMRLQPLYDTEGGAFLYGAGGGKLSTEVLKQCALVEGLLPCSIIPYARSRGKPYSKVGLPVDLEKGAQASVFLGQPCC